ncbi:hypothetical protein NB646_05080 [Oxalobacter aliiformigenes]|uniref:Uncharacterized protein n=1 Tax=Oxalobacter aliiformigenes TaxID=2946593 RepID=A0A9E9LF57_9BURK|nr:hypothetical protein [Oxalobacter aliiformigenes]WAV92093.1 hypothetical protein NB646_05080 [Oxalobacter aliiformigenes]
MAKDAVCRTRESDRRLKRWDVCGKLRPILQEPSFFRCAGKAGLFSRVLSVLRQPDRHLPVEVRMGFGERNRYGLPDLCRECPKPCSGIDGFPH